MAFVRVGESLRAPVGMKLRRQVEVLLRRGQRSLVIDLSHVADLDAAGIGELVHLYRQALAADAVLRLAHAGGRVRRLLDRAGLVELLSVDPCCQERCS
jgi:anti-anti-sigma factor